mgnify:CR=1 FL=1
MAVGFSNTNKPLNPRGQDASPKGYNRAKLFSGKALDFDGVNDGVSLNGFTMAGTTATFVFNVNFDAITINQFVFDLKPVRFVIGLSDITGNPFGLFDNSQWQAFGDLEPSQWHSISVSIDGTSAKMYLNGQSFGNEITMANAIDFDSATEVGLGSNFSGGGGFVNGQIAGFKIFNTALTAAQVADLYNNPEKVVPTGVDNTALKLWLPMQEGAGTTAYDGSGNGNHGTISGATYTHGIGAPVAQTAVIDWNKGSNYVKQSEDFDNSDWSKLLNLGGTLDRTPNYAEAPDGSQTATRIEASHDGGAGDSYAILSTTASTNTTGSYTSAVWIKSNTGSAQTISFYTRGSATNTLDITTEWVRYDIVGSGSSNYFNFGARSSTGTTQHCDFLVWGASINYGTEVDSYVPTYGSGQENDVLLPQGLTSGRDITGVNLFENVRKQGALNLDGNSWAEVHDNASLDITDAITLEAWVQNSEENNKGLLGRWFAGTACYMLYKPAADNTFNFYINSNYVSSGVVTARDWHHVVGVYDGATKKVYVNGVLANSLNETATINTSSDPIEIGRFYGGPDTRTLENQIAQPRIYNRALTAAEVLQNYNSGKNTYTNN